MNLLIAIVILGALVVGLAFIGWKFGEFIAKHGGKLVNIAIAVTCLALFYVVVGKWIYPLPGIPEMETTVDSLRSIALNFGK